MSFTESRTPLLRRLEPRLARSRLELDSGAALELGRGTDDELLARTERFARTYTQVAAKWRQPLEYADLRHADGYAVRLRGVSTTAPVAARTN